MKYLYTILFLSLLSFLIYNVKSRNSDLISVTHKSVRGVSLAVHEFKKAQWVGPAAPPLDPEAESMLKSFSIIKNPKKHSYTEACAVATQEAIEGYSEAEHRRIASEVVDQNPELFNVTVDYVLEAQVEGISAKFLLVAWRGGHHQDLAPPGTIYNITPLVWEDGTYKMLSGFSNPDLTKIMDSLPVNKLTKIKEIE